MVGGGEAGSGLRVGRPPRRPSWSGSVDPISTPPLPIVYWRSSLECQLPRTFTTAITRSRRLSIGMFVWLQTRMPLPTDPQQRQMQQMMRYMPILFGVMLYSYAAALLVYMVTSMAWSMVENAIVKKILGPMDPNVAAMAPQPI